MDQIESQALQTLTNNRVAVFIVAYNAERHIERVLQRIPEWVAERLAEIYVIDDHSPDSTFDAARRIEWPDRFAPLRIYRTPCNQGYGGNQRLGYLYAIEQGFDIVVLLHGDGQYAPEALPSMLAPYADRADAVFGSRFLNPRAAITGGMPVYKWIGNRILTAVQNYLLNAHMSEMHSGYRSYRTSALRQVPFEQNSLDFAFDADIIVQFLAAGLKITEVPIPTYYGDEICHVNGVHYAWQCVKAAVKYRLMQFEIFYEPKFDVRPKAASHYTAKLAPTSVHYHIRQRPIEPGSKVIDVGGGRGDAAARWLAQRGVEVTCIDQFADPSDAEITQRQVDLDRPWEPQFDVDQYDAALALDVLEHLRSPEKAVAEIFKHLKSGGKLYASTGNVAYLPVRLSLAVGWFNYGRKGILDLTHTRLFTVASFRRLLENGGFRIDRIIGFGPPVQDLTRSHSPPVKWVDRMFAAWARAWPTLFAYQIFIEATRADSPADLMQHMFGSAESDGLSDPEHPQRAENSGAVAARP